MFDLILFFLTFLDQQVFVIIVPYLVPIKGAVWDIR